VGALPPHKKKSKKTLNQKNIKKFGDTCFLSPSLSL
jgi:hypothetical protein